MTVIVGLVHKNVVYLGGDSAGVSGYDITIRTDPKVFVVGPCAMGFTSSFRMGQLLHYAFVVPAIPAENLEKFMATTFIDAVRDCLRAGGWLTKENEREEGGTFLVGVAGRLFYVHDDFQVGEAADKFAAVGCGREIALGALYATSHLEPHERLRVALEAAERFSAGVRGPFVYASI